jgi:hypothetical protein
MVICADLLMMILVYGRKLDGVKNTLVEKRNNRSLEWELWERSYPKNSERLQIVSNLLS